MDKSKSCNIGIKIPCKSTNRKYIEEIRSTVKESVEAHQISDVKVGSFLSGGIDSSYITSLLRPDKSFSVGFADYEDMFNEEILQKIYQIR